MAMQRLMYTPVVCSPSKSQVMSSKGLKQGPVIVMVVTPMAPESGVMDRGAVYVCV